MKKILALYDKDQVYTERLGRYLRHRRELPYQVHSFPDTESLRLFSKTKAIDVLLAAEDPEHGSEEIPAKERILLSEEPALPEGKSAIYKYQSGAQLVQELMGHYGTGSPGEYYAQGQQKTACYMVFSPVGRSGKSTFSLQLARALSKEGKTLLLSLEESGSLAAHFPNQTGRGLSEVLYHYKDGTLSEEHLAGLLREEQGFFYLPPVKNPDDLGLVSPQEIGELIQKLGVLSHCVSVVLDTDTMMSRFSESFSVCKRVFVPIREDAASDTKLRCFHRFLEGSGGMSVPDRFVKLLLPVPTAEQGRDRQYEEQLTRYTEAVVQRYVL